MSLAFVGEKKSWLSFNLFSVWDAGRRLGLYSCCCLSVFVKCSFLMSSKKWFHERFAYAFINLHSSGTDIYAEIFFCSFKDVFELCFDHLKDKEPAWLVCMCFPTFNVTDFSYAQGSTFSSFTTCPIKVQKIVQRCEFILNLLAGKPAH